MLIEDYLDELKIDRHADLRSALTFINNNFLAENYFDRFFRCPYNKFLHRKNILLNNKCVKH